MSEVGLRLMLEPLADLRVVERERGGVGEALRELELAGAERRFHSGAVEVEHALDLRPRDQRNRDERLRLDRRAGDDRDARMQVRLVRVHRLAATCGPAGDALVERDAGAHDLVRVLVAGEDGRQERLRLVGLVDRDRVVRDQVGERVRDPDEHGVEGLLGEELVEDVGEAAIRLDELGWTRLLHGDALLREETQVSFDDRRRMPQTRHSLLAERALPSIGPSGAPGLPRVRDPRRDQAPKLTLKAGG